ncbi:MAG TPA: M13 family metallopeptidase [Acidobacteriaceae bacterium]|jgi:endothelin-converting enzyme/putative endopeptidase|nr:M13 family metallopeptidase [Acidobacteriaceae bacterium]
MFKLLAALAAVTLSVPVIAPAQQPAAAPPVHPLAQMPYSPSLDLTDMDRSADPCVDFYQYSCGGWIKNNPIPPDQANWSVYGKMATENEQFLWGILEQDAKPSPTRTAVQQKIGDYFEACMNTAQIDAAGLTPAQPALAQINRLTTRKELIAALASINHNDPGSFFFNSGTEQDAADSSVMIAGVDAGGLGLPDRDYYLKMDAHSVKLRAQYVAFVQQMLTLAGEPADKASSDADAIMRIETALAKASLTRVQRRNPHNIYHRMTVAQLSELAPSIDWPNFFATQDAPGVAMLNVSQPDFIKAVQNELATEPLAALRAYLRFHLLTGSAPFLAQPIRLANFDFYSKTLRGVPVEPPRWKTCVRAVDRNLGEDLGQEFVARTFSPRMKAETQLMTTQIETAMANEIKNLDWMSPETKAHALEKLHAIRNKIGYPDRWRDYSTLQVKRDDYFGDAVRANHFEDARQWHKLGKPVDLNEWDMTPPTVNAYFNPQMNDINFPAGVLQPPLYDPKMDDAPNYGNTGGTIGHELTHAFDDEGRQFDAKGNLRDWWTPADAKGFETRINCIRDQYAQYTVVDDIHINSKLTSGEDVADLGGELLAYIAWQMQEQGRDLHDIDGFTPDQRFFIGMAQWACESERPASLRVHAATDPHSPGFARINGVVANMPQFQKAFGCKVGQPMVHTPTCRVW